MLYNTLRTRTISDYRYNTLDKISDYNYIDEESIFDSDECGERSISDYWNNHSRYSIMKLSKWRTKSRNGIQIDVISSEI